MRYIYIINILFHWVVLLPNLSYLLLLALFLNTGHISAGANVCHSSCSDPCYLCWSLEQLPHQMINCMALLVIFLHFYFEFLFLTPHWFQYYTVKDFHLLWLELHIPLMTLLWEDFWQFCCFYFQVFSKTDQIETWMEIRAILCNEFSFQWGFGTFQGRFPEDTGTK